MTAIVIEIASDASDYNINNNYYNSDDSGYSNNDKSNVNGNKLVIIKVDI